MPSKSKQQQKFMGIVRSIQKGDQPASKFSKDAQNAADDMKKKDVEDFASTKHKGLPKKVEQALREKIRTMVEDYVESCGYVVSAKDPNYKLKSPGGTGEEDRELKEEGFGSDEFLTKTEKKKFEKERLENAEVLGYTLTGTKDLKEAVDEGDFISAIQSIQAGLDEAEYGFNDLGRLKGMSSSEKRIVKTLFSRFKVLMRGVEKARRVITTESINEDGHTDVASSKRKVMIMVDDSNKLLNKLNGMNKEDSLPSWWSDKITLSQNYLEKATNYLLNPVESVNESKKEKDQIIRYLQGLGFDERTAKKAVAKSYNYISKAYRNTGTQYKGDLIANILNKKESVNESRDFEKLYKFFSKKDYFGLKRVMKTQLGNYKRALKKGDKGAQKYSEKDVINSVNRMIKNRAKFTYDELKKAIKKKDIKALKSKLRYDQPYSLAIFNQITGKKLPKNTRDIHSFLDNQFMKESVFAVRQDKIKNGERFPKKPNFNYDPEKGKSRIRKVNETMKPSAIKKMRAEFERTGELPPHLKKFVKDVNILKKKHKVKNIVVPGLEWMSDMKEQSVNEARLNPKETIQQLGGNRFLYMVGAKNLAVDKPRNELHMKIMRNAKGVSHVVVRLTSLDLYDMKFLSIRAGKIRVKATEKGVYGDQLATFFKKHTGLNTRL
jgi:hypothetical protein